VQTCALPICHVHVRRADAQRRQPQLRRLRPRPRRRRRPGGRLLRPRRRRGRGRGRTGDHRGHHAAPSGFDRRRHLVDEGLSVELVWLIPALPVAGFLLLLTVGRKLDEPFAGVIGTLAVAGWFLVSCVVGLDLLSQSEEKRQFVQTLWVWMPVGSFHVDFGFLLDPLSITMCLFITGIGALIHLYSIGYMKGDPAFGKFFMYLNLFVASMLLLVLGQNLLVTFLGWEGV